MGDSNSTLPSEPLPFPLTEKVKELDPWHTLKNPGLGVGFTEEEKHEWWKKKDYKYKLGTIRSIDLDTIITIYSETFDMSKKQRRIKKDPAEKDIEPLTDKNIEKIRTNTSINLGGFDEELIQGNLDTMKTVTQFEDLYFGWLPLKEADKASLIIKETMKTLFRFVFGKKTINDKNKAEKFYAHLRFAYTKFEPQEKVPCKGTLADHFKSSLEFRLAGVKKEIIAARQTGFPEYGIYRRGLSTLEKGLIQMIDFLDSQSGCFEYGRYSDDAKRTEDGEEDSQNFLRALMVAKQIVDPHAAEDATEGALKTIFLTKATGTASEILAEINEILSKMQGFNSDKDTSLEEQIAKLTAEKEELEKRLAAGAGDAPEGLEGAGGAAADPRGPEYAAAIAEAAAARADAAAARAQAGAARAAAVTAEAAAVAARGATAEATRIAAAAAADARAAVAAAEARVAQAEARADAAERAAAAAARAPGAGAPGAGGAGAAPEGLGEADLQRELADVRAQLAAAQAAQAQPNNTSQLKKTILVLMFSLIRSRRAFELLSAQMDESGEVELERIKREVGEKIGGLPEDARPLIQRIFDFLIEVPGPGAALDPIEEIQNLIRRRDEAQSIIALARGVPFGNVAVDSVQGAIDSIQAKVEELRNKLLEQNNRLKAEITRLTDLLGLKGDEGIRKKLRDAQADLDKCRAALDKCDKLTAKQEVTISVLEAKIAALGLPESKRGDIEERLADFEAALAAAETPENAARIRGEFANQTAEAAREAAEEAAEASNRADADEEAAAAAAATAAAAAAEAAAREKADSEAAIAAAQARAEAAEAAAAAARDEVATKDAVIAAAEAAQAARDQAQAAADAAKGANDEAKAAALTAATDRAAAAEAAATTARDEAATAAAAKEAADQRAAALEGEKAAAEGAASLSAKAAEAAAAALQEARNAAAVAETEAVATAIAQKNAALAAAAAAVAEKEAAQAALAAKNGSTASAAAGAAAALKEAKAAAAAAEKAAADATAAADAKVAAVTAAAKEAARAAAAELADAQKEAASGKEAIKAVAAAKAEAERLRGNQQKLEVEKAGMAAELGRLRRLQLGGPPGQAGKDAAEIAKLTNNLAAKDAELADAQRLAAEAAASLKRAADAEAALAAAQAAAAAADARVIEIANRAASSQILHGAAIERHGAISAENERLIGIVVDFIGKIKGGPVQRDIDSIKRELDEFPIDAERKVKAALALIDAIEPHIIDEKNPVRKIERVLRNLPPAEEAEDGDDGDDGEGDGGGDGGEGDGGSEGGEEGGDDGGAEEPPEEEAPPEEGGAEEAPPEEAPPEGGADKDSIPEIVAKFAFIEEIDTKEGEDFDDVLQAYLKLKGDRTPKNRSDFEELFKRWIQKSAQLDKIGNYVLNRILSRGLNKAGITQSEGSATTTSEYVNIYDIYTSMKGKIKPTSEAILINYLRKLKDDKLSTQVTEFTSQFTGKRKLFFEKNFNILLSKITELINHLIEIYGKLPHVRDEFIKRAIATRKAEEATRAALARAARPPVKAKPKSSGGASGRPRVEQSGGFRSSSKASRLCDLMLTSILLKLDGPEFNYKALIDKAGKTLDDIGQCDLILEMLNHLIDEHCLIKKTDGYNFSSVYMDVSQAKALVEAFNNNFTDSEKKKFYEISGGVFNYKVPDEQILLGKHPFFLVGTPREEETPLYGVLDEEIMLTVEERSVLEEGSIPIGAILFLYIVCFRENEGA